MKIQPNMYVRTKNGNIRKIVELTNTKFIDEPDYYVDKFLIDIEQNEREDTIYMRKWLFNEEIVKSSNNIIDLIEVGDYVNGYPVYETIEYPDNTRAIVIADDNKSIIWEESSQYIKSIVTKEMFESMKYEVK